jgi:hypothetical protein
VFVSQGDSILGFPDFPVAVGDAGVCVTRADNGTWVPLSTGTIATLHSVFAFTALSAWAVGDGGVILKWNGIAWSAYTSPTTATLRTVHGSGSLLLIGGDGGTLLYLHYQGQFQEVGVAKGTVGRRLADIFAVSSLSPCLEYGLDMRGKGMGDAGSAILLSPDSDHAAAINLKCGSGDYRGFDGYDTLEMWIKRIASRIDIKSRWSSFRNHLSHRLR